MRKSKTGVFHGGWMDGRVNERDLRLILRNEIVLGDHDAIIATLSRAMAVYRFDRARRAIEPEPADWAGLVAAIEVSWPMDVRAVETLRRNVRSLPLKVAAVLEAYLFKEAGIGIPILFERMMLAPSESDFRLVESALQGLSEATRLVRGIPGPKADIATPLRKIVNELMRQGMKTGRARTVGSDLLNTCGIPAPKGRSQLSELMRD